MLNVSRSSDSRDQFESVVASISRHCFVPLSVGGWITDQAYAQKLLRAGADKLVLNTALQTDPDLVTALSNRYGKQCIVASMDVFKSDEDNAPMVYVDRGAKDTGIEPVAWAKKAVDLGAGEIFFNSINHDGARKGYDVKTISRISGAVEVPVIAFGGVFRWKHLIEGFEAGADAVAVANQFHYTEQATKKAKSHLAEAGIPVRAEGRFVF